MSGIFYHYQGFNDRGSKDLLVSKEEVEAEGDNFDPNDYFVPADHCDDWEKKGEADLELDLPDLPDYLTSS